VKIQNAGTRLNFVILFFTFNALFYNLITIEKGDQFYVAEPGDVYLDIGIYNSILYISFRDAFHIVSVA